MEMSQVFIDSGIGNGLSNSDRSNKHDFSFIIIHHFLIHYPKLNFVNKPSFLLVVGAVSLNNLTFIVDYYRHTTDGTKDGDIKLGRGCTYILPRTGLRTENLWDTIVGPRTELCRT